MRVVSQTWAELKAGKDYLPKTVSAYKRTWAILRLIGSEDLLLDEEPKHLWNDPSISNLNGKGCSVREWRSLILAAQAEGSLPKPQTLTELFSTFDTPHCPSRADATHMTGYVVRDDERVSPDELRQKFTPTRRGAGEQPAQGGWVLPGGIDEAAIGFTDARARLNSPMNARPAS